MRWRRPRPAIGIWSMLADGTLEVGDIDQRFEQGSVVVAAANPDVLEDYIGKMIWLFSATAMKASCAPLR